MYRLRNSGRRKLRSIYNENEYWIPNILLAYIAPSHLQLELSIMTSATHTELSPLTHFIHTAFNEVFISPDDSVSESALYSYWSPNVEEKSVSYSLRIAHFHYPFLLNS
jgi:hypothetical protein